MPLTALAGQRAQLEELRRRGLWPAQVPSVVLTGRADSISAVGAIVVGLADARGGGLVFTSDPDDLGALAMHASSPISIVRV